MNKLYHLIKDKSNQSTYLIYILLALYALIYGYQNFSIGWFPGDDGFYMFMATNVLKNKIPFIDYFSGYTGFFDYFNSLCLTVFGNNLLSIRIPILFCNVIVILCAFHISNQLVYTKTSIFSALLIFHIYASMYIPHVNWYVFTISFLIISVQILYLKSKSNLYPLISGLLAGVSLIFKQSTGIYQIAIILLYYSFLGFSFKKKQNPASSYTKYLAVIGSLIGIIIVYINVKTFSYQFNDFREWLYFLLPPVFIFILSIDYIKKKSSYSLLYNTYLLFIAGIVIILSSYFIFYKIQGGDLSSLLSAMTNPLTKQILRWKSILPLSKSLFYIPLLIYYIILYLHKKYKIIIILLTFIWIISLFFYPFLYADNIKIYNIIWNYIQYSIPITVLCLMLILKKNIPNTNSRDTYKYNILLLLLLSITFHSLIFLPFAVHYSFFCILPFCIIAIIAILHVFNIKHKLNKSTKILVYAPLIFLLIFFLEIENKSPRFTNHQTVTFNKSNTLLNLPKGNIYVSKEEAEIFKYLTEKYSQPQFKNEKFFIYPAHAGILYYLLNTTNFSYYYYVDHYAHEENSYHYFIELIHNLNIKYIIIQLNCFTYLEKQDKLTQLLNYIYQHFILIEDTYPKFGNHGNFLIFQRKD